MLSNAIALKDLNISDMNIEKGRYQTLIIDALCSSPSAKTLITLKRNNDIAVAKVGKKAI